MLTLTDTAKDILDNHFADQEKGLIRVLLAPGCSGPRLALALDEPKENDERYEQGGYTFLVDKHLMEAAAPITLKGEDGQFVIESSMKFPEGDCGSCGGGCSC